MKDQAQAAKRSEVPTLDDDPFVDARDWEIAWLRVSTKTAGANAATATVTFTNFTFTNFNKPVTMTLALVKLGGRWRIADINGPNGSLQELMDVK